MKRRLSRIHYIFVLFIIKTLCFPMAPSAISEDRKLESLYEKATKLYNEEKYKEAFIFANRYAQKIKEKYGERHDDYVIALKNIASLRKEQGEYLVALELTKKTLRIREEQYGSQSTEVTTEQQNLAELYTILGFYDFAEKLYKKVLNKDKKTFGAEDISVALTLHDLANLYRLRASYAQADKLYQRSLSIYEKTMGKEDQDYLDILESLAISYRTQRRYVEAEQLYRQSLVISKKIHGPNSTYTAKIFTNLGLIYEKQSRYRAAEALYKKSITIFETLYGDEHTFVANSLTNLALLYQAQRRYNEAEKLLKRTLHIDTGTFGADSIYVAISLNNLGELYRVMGHFDLSESFLKKSLNIREKKLPVNHTLIAKTLNNLAVLYVNQKRYDLAEPLFLRAISIKEKAHQNNISSATTVTNLAAVYIARKRWKHAYNYLQKAIDIYSKGFMRNDFLSSASGSSTEKIKEPLVFKMFLKTAYQLVGYHMPDRKSFVENVFEKIQWIDNSKTSAALNQMAVRFQTGDNKLAKLLRSRQDIVSYWKNLNKQFGNQLSKPSMDSTDRLSQKVIASLTSTEKKLNNLNATIRENFPEFSRLTSPVPISVEEVQAQLGADEALIYLIDTPEWKPLSGETFVWVLTRNDIKWVRSPLGTEVLTNMVKTLRCGLDIVSWQKDGIAKECSKLLKTKYNASKIQYNNELPFNTNMAYQLYNGLFGQVSDLIKGKRLLLVPSGPLTSLPFQVLLTEEPKPLVGYSSMKWLVSEHDLTVLPSVASLRDLRRTLRPSKALEPYLGVGNPILLGPNLDNFSAFKKQDCSFLKSPSEHLKIGNWLIPEGIVKFFRGGQVDIELLKMQSPLPETADELCTVAKLLGAKSDAVILGENATEEYIKKLSSQGTLRNARIIHFATHGLLADETQSIASGNAEPSLMLTPPKKATDQDDGLLTASEITQLNINADWVILSACNTAGGDTPGAEPMSGMAKAFFYAGARALLVSHWYVDSGATVELITTSLRELRKNSKIGHAGALRAAMKKMIKSRNNSHPAYWAPFILVGEGATIREKKQ